MQKENNTNKIINLIMLKQKSMVKLIIIVEIENNKMGIECFGFFEFFTEKR